MLLLPPSTAQKRGGERRQNEIYSFQLAECVALVLAFVWRSLLVCSGYAIKDLGNKSNGNIESL